MRRSGFHSFVVLIILAAISPAAFAQNGAQSFDQYPSFIELTTTLPTGTQVVLRCGYMVPPGRPATLDPGFQEISILNEKQGIYSRFQRIDDDIVATFRSPTAGDSGLVMELVKVDGSVKAKSCQTNIGNDTIENCKPAQPINAVDQIRTEEQKMAAQCSALLNQGASQINPATASPQKTELFKTGLRQKVKILDAPTP